MYIIYLKGRAAPVEVDEVQGRAIKELFAAEPKSEQPIEVKDRMFRVSQINTIEPVKSSADREPEPQMPPLTPEEKEKLASVISRIGRELKSKGVLKGKQEHTAPNIVWHKNCQVCGRENPPNCARVCSGDCYVKLSPLEKQV